MVTSISDRPSTDAIRQRANADGFDVAAITAAALSDDTSRRLHRFVHLGRHGTMDWMASTLKRRLAPQAMWPDARSAIVVTKNYGPAFDVMARLADHDRGVISVYALNRDYHDVVKGRLKSLAQWVAARTGEAVKVFVDTAPLMEKPLAAQAGLGWQGKHTNLVSRDHGSWVFLGVILTAAELPAGAPQSDNCGSCRACLDICPTDAFPAPYQLDARRCISYLTIEHRGHIAEEFRKPMGNRIFGCDDCLAVCPWNKFAREASEARLVPRPDLVAPKLANLAMLDDQAFRAKFSGSPVKRIGRDRFVRNVLIAIGNSGEPALAETAERLINDTSVLVRAMSAWALRQLLPAERFQAIASRQLQAETDKAVISEWRGEPA